MKINHLLLGIIFFFLSCSSYKKEIDFKITDISYNKDSVEVNRLVYDSKTGILINHKKTATIVLNEIEKRDIYNYYIERKFTYPSVCVLHQDGTSSEVTIEFKKIKINNGRCSENEMEIKKHLLLYARIHTILRSKEEFQKIFPPLDVY